jgi:hypothetical protein
MTDPTQHFAAFVSPVEGHHVRRYGTLEHIGQTQGAERPVRRTSIEAADKSTARPNGVDPKVIVPLTHEEWRLYGTEYRRAISEGALKSRKPEEWVAAEEAAHAAEVARVEALKAEEAAAAEAAAKARAQAAPAPSDATKPATDANTSKKKGS